MVRRAGRGGYVMDGWMGAEGQEGDKRRIDEWDDELQHCWDDHDGAGGEQFTEEKKKKNASRLDWGGGGSSCLDQAHVSIQKGFIYFFLRFSFSFSLAFLYFYFFSLSIGTDLLLVVFYFFLVWIFLFSCLGVCVVS